MVKKTTDLGFWAGAALAKAADAKGASADRDAAMRLLMDAGLLDAHLHQIIVDPFFRYELVSLINACHAMSPDQLRAFKAHGGSRWFVPLMRVERACGIVFEPSEIKALLEVPAPDDELSRLKDTHIILPYTPRITIRVLYERLKQRTVVMVNGVSGKQLEDLQMPPLGWYAFRAEACTARRRCGEVDFAEIKLPPREGPLPLSVLLLADLVGRTQIGHCFLIGHDVWTSSQVSGERVSAYGGSLAGDPILAISASSSLSKHDSGAVAPAIYTGYRLGG